MNLENLREDIEDVSIPLLHRALDSGFTILKPFLLFLCLVHKNTAVNSGVTYEKFSHSNLLGCETQAMKEVATLSCCGVIDHLWVNAEEKVQMLMQMT